MNGTETLAASVHVQTFGCQMNEYDAELVRTLLRKRGYAITSDPEGARVLLINTCAVRESAHTRIYPRLHSLVNQKREDPELVVGVLGCMAQNLKEEILLDFPAVDFVCGPDGYRSLPDLIERARVARERGTAVELSEYETYEDIVPTRVEGVNAWIAVMRGCDNFCTFCVVPYTRGRERSRDPEGIVAESQALAATGHVQVTLLGQNVNSYRFGPTDFAGLMERVAGVEGIARVRFTSPHPKDFPDSLLRVIAEHPRICSHIHLPLQAGSNRILHRMNRRYTREEYLKLLDRIRTLVPGVSLTTDIICGFPGESGDDYQETVDTVQRARYDSAYIFKYSERKGTVALKLWRDDVSDEEKSERVTRLVGIQKEISLEKNQERIGRLESVLVEGTSKKDPSEWKARNDSNIIVVFADPTAAVGSFRRVRIVDASAHTLRGEIV
jgi:tRNA-2-methylthio-N6-dimethylallyladenosine synthase